jgi:hypothetical protein
MRRSTNLCEKLRLGSVLAIICFVTILALPGYSESSDAPSAPGPVPAPVEVATAPPGAHTTSSFRPFSKLAVGITVGTFGPGVEIATPLSRRGNLRVDGSFFNYDLSLTQNGVNYAANLKLREVRASYDFFPFHGGFRLSGGVVVYNGFNVNGTGTVPVGQTVTFNSQDYTVQTPLQGTASLAYANKVAPTFTFGWGNAIPRSGRHLAFPIEIGAAYAGTPKFDLAMNSGSACVAGTTICGPVTSVDGFQSNLTIQKNKIINDLKPARFYPILNTGVTYRF